jgi:hypothetical protein
MSKQLSLEAKNLADFMSQLSESAFSAQWMSNLEYALWRAVETGPYQYGQTDLTVEHIDKLKFLSSLCGGWIIFHDMTEETFVPIEQWQEIYREFNNAL